MKIQLYFPSSWCLARLARLSCLLIKMVEDRSRTLVFSFLMYPDCSCHGLVQNKYHYSLRRARRAILVKTEVGDISLYSLQIRIFQIKTKCILFCGRVNSVEYPVPVLLDGKELSWVQPAGHLGHTHCTRWLPWSWTARSGEPSLSTGQLK